MSTGGLQYREFDAPAPTASYVRCLWRLCGDSTGIAGPEAVVPDGCAELVLNLGDAFIRHTAEGSHRQSLRLVAGQITRAIAIQPSGRIDLWGIRFHPWGAAPFLGFSGAEMRDRLTSLEDLSTSIERQLAELGARASEDTQHAALGDVLMRQLARARKVDARLIGLVRHVGGTGEPFTVRGLARHAGLSVRRVQCLFEDDVGLSPKQLHRIHRFQRALALRRARPRLTWSAVAANAGYYDHAHFVHDARDLTGSAPSELLGGEITESFLGCHSERSEESAVR
jgi:AraC-like DNA-binding protein